MRADVDVPGVGSVAMLPPSRRMDVHFDISPQASTFGADLQVGPQEVGAGLQVPDSGVQDADRVAFRGAQVAGPQRRVEPDALQLAFRGRNKGQNLARFVYAFPAAGTEGAVQGGAWIGAHRPVAFPARPSPHISHPTVSLRTSEKFAGLWSPCSAPDGWGRLTPPCPDS